MAGWGKEEKGSLDHFLSTQTCVHVGNSSQIYEHDHDIHRKLKSKNWEIGSVCECGCRKSPTKEEIDPRKF